MTKTTLTTVISDYTTYCWNELRQYIVENYIAKSSYIDCTSMSSNTKKLNDNTEKLGITLPKSILQKVDNVRGDVPRSTFIRRAVESYLSKGSRTKSGN